MPCQQLKDCNASAGLHIMQLGFLMSCMPCRMLKAPQSWLACTADAFAEAGLPRIQDHMPCLPMCRLFCRMLGNPSAMACLRSSSPSCLGVPACPAGR